jgi:hypothetical protein
LPRLAKTSQYLQEDCSMGSALLPFFVKIRYMRKRLATIVMTKRAIRNRCEVLAISVRYTARFLRRSIYVKNFSKKVEEKRLIPMREKLEH